MAEDGSVTPEMKKAAVASLARLHADDADASDERAFREWLDESPTHAAAFEAVTDVWETLGQAWDEPLPVTRPSLFTRRRALLAGAGTAAAAGIFAALQPSAYAEVHETGVGEFKHVVLHDGSEVFLDTDTRIQAVFDGQCRTVALDRGRCNVAVLAEDGRVFAVNAAGEHITTNRAVLDVRRDNDNVCVILLRGSASIDSPAGKGVTLKPGQRLVARGDGARVDSPDLAPLLAWQLRQVVFDNVPLHDAVREMNRYSSIKLTVSDFRVGEMRINGVYRVGDNAAFARSVARLLPLVVQAEPGQVELLFDPSRPIRNPV